MIETSTAITADRPDASYQSWNKTVRQTAARLSYHSDRTAGPIPAFGTMVHGNASFVQSYAPGEPARAEITYDAVDDTTGFGFDDVIDIINPLQHLPVIGTLYRKFTGDVIGPMASVIGGAIFGGPVGAVSSLANVAVKESTGRDVGENIMALAGFDTEKAPPSRKPTLTFDKPLPGNNLDGLAGTTLAVANLSAPARTVKNFAAVKPVEQRWNS